MTTTLQTVSGIQARIFELPNRPPFMVAADLADAYGTEPKYINRAVSRNPDRFPEDFAFRLTEAEAGFMYEKWSQFGTTSAGQRTDVRPLVFTHAGAIALSGVLKTPIAAEVSVIVHRAYAAMEKRALDDTRILLLKIQNEALIHKASRIRVLQCWEYGMDFEAMWQTASMSRPKLAEVVWDCFRLGLIGAPLKGTPTLAPAPERETSQPDLFAS